LGDIALPEVNAVDSVTQVETADFVFLAVKLWDTEAAAPDLGSLAERGTAIISFQNGVQKDELLLKYLPRASVIGGVSYISAAIQGPGVIQHFGPIQKLVFGEFDGERSRRSVDLQMACEHAGIGAAISEDI
jgi:2-dehydropantoate 2-reductase